ncbi:MAG: hypothetical protein EOP88_26175, partial [Verrucomicrobiaceae bacterium]
MQLRRLSPALFLTVLASCSPYTNHIPVTKPGIQEEGVVSMKMGERKKIATLSRGSLINPVPTLGPAHYLSSSDPSVLAIEGKPFEKDAWAKAIKPGKVDIRYGKDSGREGQTTRVV